VSCHFGAMWDWARACGGLLGVWFHRRPIPLPQVVEWPPTFRESAERSISELECDTPAVHSGIRVVGPRVLDGTSGWSDKDGRIG